MNYKREADDVCFRIVGLKVTAVPDFEKFTIDNQVISIPDEQLFAKVLEIQRKDGSTFVKGPDRKIEKFYTVLGNDKIYFPSDLPYARLWVKHTNYPLPCYKVPNVLEEEASTKRVYIQFYGGAQNAELIGDKYFNAVYNFQRST